MPTKVCVLGSGQMGQGIAQVAASIAGNQVVLYDVDNSALDRAQKSISESLQKLESKGKIPAGMAQQALARIVLVPAIEAINQASGGGCDLYVEAIVENANRKRELLHQLDSLAPAGAILASNTSSIPIATLATATKRPAQVIGMHFMNPVPLMSLVEIIRSPLTSDATYEKTKQMAEAMGKQTVCSQDFPGFIVNRLLMPMINEAFFALHEKLASAEDIDRAMKLGTNQPMGPLALADFIGLDTCLFILEVLHRDLGDPKFRPSPLLKQYVQAGMLGKKNKRGVFNYE